MVKFIVGFIVGIVAITVAGYLFVVTGGMPVATQGGPMPLEKWVANTSIRAAIGSAGQDISPTPASDENLTAGAKAYVEDCAGCHGVPGQASPMHEAMYPHPPQFFAHRGGKHGQVGATHWVVKNGIRLTAM